MHYFVLQGADSFQLCYGFYDFFYIMFPVTSPNCFCNVLCYQTVFLIPYNFHSWQSWILFQDHTLQPERWPQPCFHWNSTINRGGSVTYTQLDAFVRENVEKGEGRCGKRKRCLPAYVQQEGI